MYPPDSALIDCVANGRKLTFGELLDVAGRI